MTPVTDTTVFPVVPEKTGGLQNSTQGLDVYGTALQDGLVLLELKDPKGKEAPVGVPVSTGLPRLLRHVESRESVARRDFPVISVNPVKLENLDESTKLMVGPERTVNPVHADPRDPKVLMDGQEKTACPVVVGIAASAGPKENVVIGADSARLAHQVQRASHGHANHAHHQGCLQATTPNKNPLNIHFLKFTTNNNDNKNDNVHSLYIPFAVLHYTNINLSSSQSLSDSSAIKFTVSSVLSGLKPFLSNPPPFWDKFHFFLMVMRPKPSTQAANKARTVLV